MKKIIIFWGILYCICFCNIPLFSQNKTAFHYPLNIRDSWEYRYYSLGVPFTYLTRKVIGDTLMPNGKVYRIIEEYSPPYGTSYFFQRINDSNEVFHLGPYRQDEFLLYKLDIKVGDTWPYPPDGWQGFFVESGLVEVIQIADTTLRSNKFKFASIASFTLPDTATWFDPDVILVDSLGVFIDSFEGGWLELQGAIINNKRFGTITSVHSFETSPSENTISNFNAYPNPFNSFTVIEYKLNNAGRVRITIFNVLGEKVILLDATFQTPGLYRRKWFGENESGELVASGTYIYTIEVNDVIITKKTILFLK